MYKSFLLDTKYTFRSVAGTPAREGPSKAKGNINLQRIRELQIKALETQIQANEAVTNTCANINGLLPKLSLFWGGEYDALKDACS